MPNIQFSFDATDEEITNLSDELGYQETVREEQDVFDEDGNKTGTERVEVDNPQTRQEYVIEKAKEHLVPFLTRRIERNIKNDMRQQRREKIDTKQQEYKDRIDVTVS
jgi:hypothetical protein